MCGTEMRAVLALVALFAACGAFAPAGAGLRVAARQRAGAPRVVYMANSPQSKKRARQAEKRNAVNTVWRSKYRNLMKKTAAAMKAGDAETAKASYSLAVKMIQKTASKNIIHKNKSNRLVSRLTLKYNAFTRGEDFRQAKHFEISPRIVDTSVFAEQLKQYELCQASEACVADLDDIAVTTKLGQEQAAAAEAA